MDGRTERDGGMEGRMIIADTSLLIDSFTWVQEILLSTKAEID